MSFNEVLAELPSLTVEQRQLLMRRALELDDLPLSPEEKRLVDERVTAYRRNPAAGIPWQVAKADIRRDAGL